MTPGCITFIAAIRPGEETGIACYLRDQVDPRRLDAATGRLVCQPAFPFDAIPTLHFCAMLILPADQELPAKLVIEATFDGSREDFVDALLGAMKDGLDAILSRCAGYPESGPRIPLRVKEYLLAHDVRFHTFFSGTPGRSVAQIRDEASLRERLVEYKEAQRTHPGRSLPVTLRGLQKEMQRAVVGEERWRWAAQPAAVPWQVRHRRAVLEGAKLAAYAAAAGLGAAVLALLGYSRDRTAVLIGTGFEAADELGRSLLGHGAAMQWLGDAIVRRNLAALFPVLGLALVWLVLRAAGVVIGYFARNPRRHSFTLNFLVYALWILRGSAWLMLLGYAAMAVLEAAYGSDKPDLFSVRRLQVAEPVAGSAPGTVPAVQVVGVKPSVMASLSTLGLLLVSLLVLHHWKTTLRLAVQFRELEPAAEHMRRFLLDVMRLAMRLVLVLGVLVLVRHLSGDVLRSVAGTWSRPLLWLLMLAACGTVGLIVGSAAIGFATVLPARLLELLDRHRYRNPKLLIDVPRASPGIAAREEGGTNLRQNHLATLNTVKPGRVRRWLLWQTLLVVHVLGRHWFNQGSLGGIPTILSARWVVIDGGRRLLFLDNYTGAWDSYLNEFIDLGAVKGLNAIWTNTFTKAGPQGESYGFPATKSYYWKGAQEERPFKAYVRHSQIETLVWYGAYPTLSCRSINASTELRQALMAERSEHQIGDLLKRL